jgi:glyoxalase family protein
MIHHITAITENIKENFNFYTKTLGMSFVKKTINFDDPSTYHLYYGDKKATPGSLITFFYYKGKGKKGKGFAEGIILQVPKKIYDKLGSIIEDPDGLTLKLKPGKDFKALGVITTASKEFLSKFNINSENEYVNYGHFGSMGAGLIHHVAHSTDDDISQIKIREKLLTDNINVSPVMERFYFKSIYFREENGCLQEIATYGPGFFVDEKKLGSKLVLPPWYEQYRTEIESNLVEL